LIVIFIFVVERDKTRQQRHADGPDEVMRSPPQQMRSGTVNAARRQSGREVLDMRSPSRHRTVTKS